MPRKMASMGRSLDYRPYKISFKHFFLVLGFFNIPNLITGVNLISATCIHAAIKHAYRYMDTLATCQAPMSRISLGVVSNTNLNIRYFMSYGAKKYSAALSHTIGHEKVVLTCSLRVVWPHSVQQISFTTNSFQIFSLEIHFLTCASES